MYWISVRIQVNSEFDWGRGYALKAKNTPPYRLTKAKNALGEYR